MNKSSYSLADNTLPVIYHAYLNMAVQGLEALLSYNDTHKVWA